MANMRGLGRLLLKAVVSVAAGVAIFLLLISRMMPPDNAPESGLDVQEQVSADE